MNNSLSTFVSCGLEVSQHTLVVALRAGDHDEAPREYSSGTSVHKKVRISKAGNKHFVLIIWINTN